MDADRIVVLERGRVAGIGRHAELLESCSTYRACVEAQARATSGASLKRGRLRVAAGPGWFKRQR